MFDVYEVIEILRNKQIFGRNCILLKVKVNFKQIIWKF